MARKHHKPEEIVAKLRQVEVLTAQGKPVAEAVRAIGVTEATYYRWRSEYGGLKLDQVKRLKLLGQENGRAVHVWTARWVQEADARFGGRSIVVMCAACLGGTMTAGPDGIRERHPNNAPACDRR